jgi:misacylated tRNA(Ala) deacylase
MSQQLYLLDCYLKEWNAEIKSVSKGKYVVLDQTAFYPNSGGQPHDTGVMITEDGKEYKVVYTGKFSGKISHEVDKEGLKTGDKVHCKIDWDRRYKFMRYHTASHVVDKVIFDDCGADITGNQITLKKTRIDFSIPDFDREKIKEYGEKANEIIQRNIPIELELLPRDQAEEKYPHLFRLEKAFPDHIKQIRTVTLKDLDTQACGGTHVKNTSEIGTIEVFKVANKGKNNRRIYFRLI